MRELFLIFILFALTISHSYTQLHPLNKMGPLRDKAEKYDTWNIKHHHPYYGGQVGVLFGDEAYSKVIGYDTMGDSCIWTGTYLGSQALKYAVTRSPEAKANAIMAIKALDGFLHVTSTKGYIARYWAPVDSISFMSEQSCKQKNSRCHEVNSGKYAGDFWLGDTTKDQYNGWFLGMALAHAFIDDEEIRKVVKNDVAEVVDKLITSKWIILDEKGKYEYFSAAQRPSYADKLCWLTIAYDVTGKQKYKDEFTQLLKEKDLKKLEFTLTSLKANKYFQYYAHNLGHTAWYNILRLGQKHYPRAAYERLKDIFIRKVHGPVKLSHNPWFNAIFMSHGDYGKEYKEQLVADLTDFMMPPKHSYHVPERDPSTYTLDPATSWLKYFPRLVDFMKKINLGLKPQASEAFPVKLQCFNEFMFQSSPFTLEECGIDFGLYVHPGHDYLIAYWTSAYHGLISKNQ